MSFKHRSYQKELLDRQDIPFADIEQNMRELDFINKYLGGHKITIKGIESLAGNARDKIHVVEIGSGGGDNLRVIKQWCQRKRLEVELTGIDINEECVRFARKQTSNKGIHFIHSDYKNVYIELEPDVIFSSLFCHHFTENELVFMMQWMHRNCKKGFFINDLHRHLLAYYSIKFFTALFSRSYLVKNDAPLSVKRGFVRKEWENILQAAAISSYEVKWKWAFRWLILCSK